VSVAFVCDLRTIVIATSSLFGHFYCLYLRILLHARLFLFYTRKQAVHTSMEWGPVNVNLGGVADKRKKNLQCIVNFHDIVAEREWVTELNPVKSKLHPPIVFHQLP
jgi:hypothetical protein